MRWSLVVAIGALMVAACAGGSSPSVAPATITGPASTAGTTTTTGTSAAPDTTTQDTTTAGPTTADPTTADPATADPTTAAPGSSTTTPPADTAVAATPSPSVAASPSPGADWLTFDGANDRRGVAASGPDPRTIRTAWTSPALDGPVYGQALVHGDAVFVATEHDSVVALSTDDGHVLWSTNLGAPVPRSALPCGNIRLTGITSTPVIDPTGAVIYVVAFVLPGEHRLVALDTATGAVRWQHLIDPPGLSPLVEQQRSALSLANGRVYVPFGGLYGDCGPYKGAIVALAADGSGETTSWVTPTTREGAIWAPPGVSIDAAGELYAAIGNAASTDPARFDYGNSVVRLSPDLTLLDWWAPTNWARLSASDRDVGSLTPIPIDAEHLFIAGKAGVGYTLRAGALGNVGGEIASASLCSAAFGGAASNGSVVVLGCSNGPTAATVTPDGAIAGAWHVGGTYSGAPVIAADVVWLASRDGHARALDLASGASVADIAVAGSLLGFPGVTVTATAVYVTGSTSVTALTAG